MELVLRQLKPLVHPDAKVTLRLLATGEARLADALESRLLQPALFFRMATDQDNAFARDKRLATEISLITPLFQPLTSNNRAENLGGEANAGDAMQYMPASDEWVQWRLRTSGVDDNDERTYHGLWPAYRGTFSVPRLVWRKLGTEKKGGTLSFITEEA